MTESAAPAAPKIAAAPISWGVSEVPNWGVQLPPERVLHEMAELGFSATEFGPLGFLPDAAEQKAVLLAGYGLRATGGFVPVVLHDPGHDPVPEVQAELASYGPAGASVLVLAAATGVDGYDSRPELDEAGWATLLGNLDRLQQAARDLGVLAVLHPHVGTMIETSADLDRVLAGSTIPFCLDTGHLFIGGTDPVAFAAAHSDRIAHAHLKDVDLALARTVQSGERTYYDAVIAGMYRPLGQGDVDVRSILRSLAGSGYDGWFVLEQDNVLSELPAAGRGPIDDARQSVAYLRAVLAEIADGADAAATPLARAAAAFPATALWNDSADPDELAASIGFGAVGATCNPVIALTAIRNRLDVWVPRIAELAAQHPAASESELGWLAVERLSIEAAALLHPAFVASGGRNGRLSIQTDPRLARDADALVRQAVHFSQLAENIIVKIPATAVGIRAIEEATYRGVSVNVTVSFTVPQAVAAAEAIERGLDRRAAEGMP